MNLPRAVLPKDQSEFYLNSRRIGKPLLFQECILFEREIGTTVDIRMSCLHVRGKFGQGICIKCVQLLQLNEVLVDEMLITAGWRERR